MGSDMAGKGHTTPHSLFSEELDALVGEGVVVPAPRELGLAVSSGSEGLECLDDKEVLHVELDVLWGVVVLLGDENALC